MRCILYISCFLLSLNAMGQGLEFVQYGRTAGTIKCTHTASGEEYNPTRFVASHGFLPIGSYARVTHLSNGKSTLVQIVDRVPGKSNSVVLLSKVAAKYLDLPRLRAGRVKIELVTPEEIIQDTRAKSVHPGKYNPPPARETETEKSRIWRSNKQVHLHPVT